MEIRQRLIAGNYYHICTKANGSEVLFRDQSDYMYFIKKMHLRLTEAWSILAYTLLPHEIHFIIKVEKKEIDGEIIDQSMLLSHLLNGYAQHYNYKYSRSGSLLHRSFRREQIDNATELANMICKIHNLPVANEIVSAPGEWQYSSYNSSTTERLWCEVAIQEIEKLFGSWAKFFKQHFEDGLKQVGLDPRKYWQKILSQLEIEFRKCHPLGVHRWCRRARTPP